ncbi:MAG: hypothetical protein SF162_14280 [bacterium]|nr:hypothetical protein [bacterium]
MKLEFDFLQELARLAGTELPAHITDPIEAAQHFSGGYTLKVYPTERVDVPIPGVLFVDTVDDADTVLLIHRENPAATAAQIEERIAAGQRVALLDLSQAAPGAWSADRADPDLIPAITHTIVYLSTLAAWDIDLRRALAFVMTPMRDGQAHRRLLALSMVYYWAWRSIVIDEVRRLFGDTIPDQWVARAETQTRSRLGAYLIKTRTRGLRFFVQKVIFPGQRVDAMRFDLVAES